MLMTVKTKKVDWKLKGSELFRLHSTFDSFLWWPVGHGLHNLYLYLYSFFDRQLKIIIIINNKIQSIFLLFCLINYLIFLYNFKYQKKHRKVYTKINVYTVLLLVYIFCFITFSISFKTQLVFNTYIFDFSLDNVDNSVPWVDKYKPQQEVS